MSCLLGKYFLLMDWTFRVLPILLVLPGLLRLMESDFPRILRLAALLELEEDDEVSTSVFPMLSLLQVIAAGLGYSLKGTRCEW